MFQKQPYINLICLTVKMKIFLTMIGVHHEPPIHVCISACEEYTNTKNIKFLPISLQLVRLLRIIVVYIDIDF